jgi:hypothetical protein
MSLLGQKTEVAALRRDVRFTQNGHLSNLCSLFVALDDKQITERHCDLRLHARSWIHH